MNIYIFLLQELGEETLINLIIKQLCETHSNGNLDSAEAYIAQWHVRSYDLSSLDLLEPVLCITVSNRQAAVTFCYLIDKVLDVHKRVVQATIFSTSRPWLGRE